MLIGHYITKIGDKRRIAVPVKFRRVLGKKMIVAKWYEGCLVLISAGSWLELMKRVTGETKMVSLSVRDIDRFILGSAFELTVDDQGRVLVPEVLSEYASLKEDVVFVGLGDRIEIWSRDEWLKREKHVAIHASELMEKLVESEK